MSEAQELIERGYRTLREAREVKFALDSTILLHACLVHGCRKRERGLAPEECIRLVFEQAMMADKRREVMQAYADFHAER